METFLIKALQLILSLSIIVIIHELGHFIPAKLFKTKVEKFYLFFDPWFSFLKIKKGETEYGIGWIPLGGYVKIAGMVDESMDKEQLKKDPEPWEFRSKPVWQRLIIMTGGVIANVILGAFIYAMLLYVNGEEFIAAKDVKYGVHVSAAAKKIGFQDGDKIISINGKFIKNEITYNEIWVDLLLNGEGKTVVVENNNITRKIIIPKGFAESVLKSGEKMGFSPRIPFFIDSIIPSGNASKSKLQKGDKVLALNEFKTEYFSDFRNKIIDFKGKIINLKIKRDTAVIVIPVEVSEEKMIDIVASKNLEEFFKITKKEYSFFSSFPAGIKKAVNTIKNYIDQFSLIFTKEGVKQMGGFGAIGNLFPSLWNWDMFWSLTALISLILAFMNILPIPALDGGHVVFLIYEMITRKKPNEKVLEKAQIIGMILLLTLVLYSNGNDIFKFLK